jgi:hypothetical protein
VHTEDVEASAAFYKSMGLHETWRLDRRTEAGVPWTLIGLGFPNAASSELVLSNHPDRRTTDIEIRVDDVRSAFETLKDDPRITWIEKPFPIEAGHVAVMRAPDGTELVLIGG